MIGGVVLSMTVQFFGHTLRKDLPASQMVLSGVLQTVLTVAAFVLAVWAINWARRLRGE